MDHSIRLSPQHVRRNAAVDLPNVTRIPIEWLRDRTDNNASQVSLALIAFAMRPGSIAAIFHRTIRTGMKTAVRFCDRNR